MTGTTSKPNENITPNNFTLGLVHTPHKDTKAVPSPVKDIYSPLFDLQNEQAAKFSQDIAKAKNNPAELARIRTNQEEHKQYWQGINEIFVEAFKAYKAPGTTDAERKDILTQLGALAKHPQEWERNANIIRALPEKSKRTSAQQAEADAAAKRMGLSNDTVRSLIQPPVTGAIGNNPPHSQEMAAWLTWGNRAVGKFTDTFTRSSTWRNMWESVFGSSEESEKTADAGTPSQQIPPPDAPNPLKTGANAPKDGGSAGASADAKEDGDKQGILGTIKNVKMDAGGIIGGGLGLGLAFLVSSIFGSGPIKWIFLLLLAPLFAILGANQMGGTINGWLGTGDKAKTGDSPAQARSPSVDSPANAQQQGSNLTPEQRAADAPPYYPPPIDDRGYDRGNDRVFRSVRDVRRSMPRGMVYEPNQSEEVYYGGRAGPRGGAGYYADPYQPGRERYSDRDGYRGEKHEINIKVKGSEGVNVELPAGMSVSNADTVGSVYVPGNSHLKIRWIG